MTYNRHRLPGKKSSARAEEKSKMDKKNDSNPFFCYLPASRGLLARLISALLFSRPKMDANLKKSLKDIENSGIIIYVNKYRSPFEYFFYHCRYLKEGLPYPALGFDYSTYFWQPAKRLLKGFVFHTGYFLKHFSMPDPYQQQFYRNRLLSGDSAMLSLIEEYDGYRRLAQSWTDPLDYLIEMQKTIDTPIYIVPQLILYDRSPQTTRLSITDVIFGTPERPGRLRRLWMMLKRPGKIWIEAAEIVCIKDFLQTPEAARLNQKSQAIYLRRYLIDQINRHRQSITGPILKSRTEIIQGVMTHPETQKIISEYAAEHKVPINKAQKEAADFLDEIAANYNLKIVRLFDICLKWIFRAMFDGMAVDQEGLSKIRQASKAGPLVLVPCHKSHLDYLILSYVFYHNNLPCPHIAAGRNLSFWPIGPLFRGGGAFFLRRTFKGEPLYPKIFSAYINKLLTEGFHMEFFIEGGRSRTGKLLPPKIGFLSLLVDAYMKNNWEDMLFVPIFIGYDRVLEEKAYIHEMEGGRKSPESLVNVLKARKFLKKKFGKIYINFHEPFSIKEHFNSGQTPFAKLGREEQKQQLHFFGEKIINAVNNESVITPHAVIAAALLNCSHKRIYYRQLLTHAETYMNYLSFRGVKMADTLYIDRQGAFETVLDTFISNKYIEKSVTSNKGGTPPNPIFKIHESKRPNLEYYKNNGVIFFAPAAYTSLSILALDAFQFTAADLHGHYAFLKDFFCKEFIFDPTEEIEPAIRKNLKAFIEDAILTPHPTLPDTYNLTSAGFRKLNLFAGFLTAYFEAYWVVLNFYLRYTKGPILEHKNYTKKIQALGSRMYKRNEVLRNEGLSRGNYKNAVTFFTHQGLLNPENEEDKQLLELYMEKVQLYRRCLPN